jgi:hypothetical protein
MNERAETHLRLLAEAELRRASLEPRDRAGILGSAEVRRVGQTLVAIDAVDAATADSIEADLRFALAIRRPRDAFGHGPGMMVNFGNSTPAIGTAVQRAFEPGTDRVVALGLTLPVQAGQVRGRLHLLSFAETASGTRFAIAAELTGAGPRSSAAFPFGQLTITDETGATYRTEFTGHGKPPSGWAGLLTVLPPPPAGVRALELVATPGHPPRRIELTAGRAPDVTLTQTSLSAGEHVLNGIAGELLMTGLHRRMTTYAPGQSPHAATSLAAIVTALEVAGALAPLSPLPGQLARLCERLGITDHGLTAPPAQDLPEPWRGLLDQPDRPPPPDGCAAVALALPEIDGSTAYVLGLRNSYGATSLNVHASGVTDANLLPALWLLDSTGRWHATQARGWQLHNNGDATGLLQAFPPVSRATWVEVLAVGRSARARATVPLRWR